MMTAPSEITKRASAAIKPDLAAALTRSFRFMELVRAFMAVIISQQPLAAMAIITTFLPSGYFSLSFDFRMSHLTQCPKVVDASDAASCVQSNWWNIDGLLRELPDGDDRAENQDRINCHLDDVTALFFRANQKRISGLFMLIFQLICRACLFFHDTTLRRHVTGRDDNDHQ